MSVVESCKKQKQATQAGGKIINI